MMDIKYNLAKEFSPYPAGRTVDESDYSGQAFREVLLEKLQSLGERDHLIISLVGLRTAGSSFLEEAFGGLVRLGVFTAQTLHKLLKFETDMPFLEEEIWHYIDRAEKQKTL